MNTPTYNFFKHMNLDVKIDISCKVHFVAYHIDNRGPVPFLLFLLEREQESEKEGWLIFPTITGPVLNMRETCASIFPEFDKVEYTGYVISEKEIYAFVHILDAQCRMQMPTPIATNKRWMCLVDEVLNYGSLLGGRLQINQPCVNFLFSNEEFYTLYVGRNICEIPNVAYMTSDNVKQTEIDHHFGPTKCDYEHYTFESQDELLGKSGFIRYAVFHTMPKTTNGKTCWFVRTLDSVVSLSYHTIC